MKKFGKVKKIGVIALSSVLAIGSLAAMSGCNGGGGDPGVLTVSIFCNDSDAQVNQSIIDRWQAQYLKDHPELSFRVDFNHTPNDVAYYTTLTNNALSGASSLSDIMYLAPRHVKKYSKLGYVMDLTEYLSPTDIDKMSGVWNNALSYYGYDGSDEYVFGQSVSYDKSKQKFVTAAGSEVGIYGLPKDYSNFALGYNSTFFSDKLVEEYQTRKGSDARNVKNPNANASVDSGIKVTPSYTGGSKVATFAASGTYYKYDANGVPDLEHPLTATAGQEAPLLCIGVPVTYTPFNFYLYNDYQSALEAGDPVACLARSLSRSRSGDGFTVTMPGLPGWTFDIKDAKGYGDENSAAYKAAVNGDAAYDSAIGHTVLTYQEYGVLSWLMTYYLNTFAWSNGQTNPLNGTGGSPSVTGDGTYSVIFGGEQYEYARGCRLYMLPWMYSSDADFVNELATTALNPGGASTLSALRDGGDQKATALAGDATEQRSKMNLDGTLRDVAVQYGMNSEQFLKVYAAYANHGALWNANSGAAKAYNSEDGLSGWDYFRFGRCIFYGAGSWDAAARNDVDPSYFGFGQMATPVAEEYALYSKTSTPDYDAGGDTMITYANANNIKGTGADAHKSDSAQASTKTAKAFAPDEIYANQILRQDKWAARMDSVGFAANGRLAQIANDPENPENWKAAAAASLVAAFTISEEDQIRLTYAGAQLPNFVQQCNEFLKYQTDEYKTDGDFKDMLTPDGFADNSKYGTEAGIGRKIWNYYMDIVVKMGNAAKNSTQTVSQWLAANNIKDYDGGEIRYNHVYENTALSTFTGQSSNRYYSAMLVFNMVNLNYASRDLNIRMQTGLNAVRDSAMYTPDDEWLNGLNAAPASHMLSYYSYMATGGVRKDADDNQIKLQQELATALQEGSTRAIARTFNQTTATGANASQWWSPALFALINSISCNSSLQTKIRDDK